MFFKKKVTIEDYCRGKLTRLFSQERETAWDDLRIRCNDAHLNQADRKAYYDNLRAAMIQRERYVKGRCYVVGGAGIPNASHRET